VAVAEISDSVSRTNRLIDFEWSADAGIFDRCDFADEIDCNRHSDQFKALRNVGLALDRIDGRVVKD